MLARVRAPAQPWLNGITGRAKGWGMSRGVQPAVKCSPKLDVIPFGSALWSWVTAVQPQYLPWRPHKSGFHGSLWPHFPALSPCWWHQAQGNEGWRSHPARLELSWAKKQSFGKEMFQAPTEHGDFKTNLLLNFLIPSQIFQCARWCSGWFHPLPFPALGVGAFLPFPRRGKEWPGALQSQVWPQERSWIHPGKIFLQYKPRLRSPLGNNDGITFPPAFCSSSAPDNHNHSSMSPSRPSSPLLYTRAAHTELILKYFFFSFFLNYLFRNNKIRHNI